MANPKCIPCKLAKKKMSNPFHILLKLLQILDEGNAQAKPKKF
jgi:hypothetical protein